MKNTQPLRHEKSRLYSLNDWVRKEQQKNAVIDFCHGKQKFKILLCAHFAHLVFTRPRSITDTVCTCVNFLETLLVRVKLRKIFENNTSKEGFQFALKGHSTLSNSSSRGVCLLYQRGVLK